MEEILVSLNAHLTLQEKEAAAAAEATDCSSILKLIPGNRLSSPPKSKRVSLHNAATCTSLGVLTGFLCLSWSSDVQYENRREEWIANIEHIQVAYSVHVPSSTV